MSKLRFLCPILGLMGVGLDCCNAESVTVFFGTYTRGTSKGIYRSQLDLQTGTLAPPRLAAETVNPSFLALHPTHKFLYAVSEIANYDGKKVGAVAAFAVDAATKNLTLLNQQASGGKGPCHLVVDATGRNVLVANYGSGTAAVLPIRKDGFLEKHSAFIQHEGSSVNPGRQKGPHAHSINLDAANRFAFVADLGLDKILIYRFDAAKGSLKPNDPPYAAVEPGAGPRHFAFHPSGRWAYVIDELNSTVTAFRYDADRGMLTSLQSLSTLPDNFDGKNTTAEVQVHSSGQFLYGSNRGHNSIAIFRIDEKAGTLTPAGHESTRGETPRNFGIDPTGTFLLAANQASDNVSVFRINDETGALSAIGEPVAVPSPVCVKFFPIGQ